MKRYATGLVVGKFAPLHLGHEALIHAALAQCEMVIIISYSSPEIPGYEPEKRLHWLQTLFPQCRHLV
ncbi:adenylyltransferase/cytidyltransferase family protein, partial [Escherichia coli]|nr:adenylyltransferase/cytidyltransferase family protein [Escherichia coli]